MRKASRIYIVGAGFAGRSLLTEIREKGIYGEVVSFLDDDSTKIGDHIHDIPILGPINDIARIIQPQNEDMAIIAMPSVSRDRLKSIFFLLKKQGFNRIKILPDLGQIVEGSAHLVQTREIDLEDLLLRKPIQIALKESLHYLREKRVLITGAGGSIGAELARQLLHGGVSRLYLFGHGENSIYEIDRELRLLQREGVGEKTSIVPIVGELQDPDYMDFIIPRIRPDVIFHTAAYKHVPMMEQNPVVAIKNNFFGSINLLNASRHLKGLRFVFISTDKAVEPTTVYGVSKRLTEELVLTEGARQDNAAMVVRFGNVLGSRGSIVPLFRQQILNGGPLTITHPDMKRFFMTIPEASSLVLKAGGMGKSGTLYTLDMGEPVVIRDLAEQMIRFYGFEPDSEIPLEYIGIRRGEKLDESLHESGEVSAATDFAGIQFVRERKKAIPIWDIAERLHPICYRNSHQAELYRNRHALREILLEYFPGLGGLDNEPEY